MTWRIHQCAGTQPANKSGPDGASATARLAIGCGARFFDTLGIGSFATTTAPCKPAGAEVGEQADTGINHVAYTSAKLGDLAEN